MGMLQENRGDRSDLTRHFCSAAEGFERIGWGWGGEKDV